MWAFFTFVIFMCFCKWLFELHSERKARAEAWKVSLQNKASFNRRMEEHDNMWKERINRLRLK